MAIKKMEYMFENIPSTHVVYVVGKIFLDLMIGNSIVYFSSYHFQSRLFWNDRGPSQYYLIGANFKLEWRSTKTVVVTNMTKSIPQGNKEKNNYSFHKNKILNKYTSKVQCIK